MARFSCVGSNCTIPIVLYQLSLNHCPTLPRLYTLIELDKNHVNECAFVTLCSKEGIGVKTEI